MKKFFKTSVVLILFMVSITACGESSTGTSATEQEKIAQSSAEETESVITVFSDDQMASVAVDGDSITVTLKTEGLENTYAVNLPYTSTGEEEYRWEVAFDDGKNQFGISTVSWKNGDEQDELPVSDMQNVLLLKHENTEEVIAEAELSVAGDTLTWTAQVPTEYAIDAKNIKISGTRFFDITNSELAASYQSQENTADSETKEENADSSTASGEESTMRDTLTEYARSKGFTTSYDEDNDQLICEYPLGNGEGIRLCISTTQIGYATAWDLDESDFYIYQAFSLPGIERYERFIDRAEQYVTQDYGEDMMEYFYDKW